MSELRNIFVRESQDRGVPEMLGILKELKKSLPSLKKKAGTRSLFGGAAVFKDVVALAGVISETYKPDTL